MKMSKTNIGFTNKKPNNSKCGTFLFTLDENQSKVDDKANYHNNNNITTNKILNKKAYIISGACSINQDNLEIIDQIANITINSQKAVAGTRIVGLKSRTELLSNSSDMGIDYEVFMNNLDVFMKTGSIENLKKLPSIDIANNTIEKYNMLIATEIMCPAMQMPLFDKYLLKCKFMPWNPAVNQLGWEQLLVSKYCAKNNWFIGFKNSKTLGGDFLKINDNKCGFSIEKVWKGLVSYASDIPNENKILIHRGVDVPEKGNFRNALIHNIAKKVKKDTGCKLFFDPSHSYGAKLRGEIPNAIIESLQMKISENEYLYDGILVETGYSNTDNEQHISVSELEKVLKEISQFRELCCR